MLLEVLDILLFYVAQGAEFIRLDAIAFLWKEIGTSCLHLPQTHRVVQLIRAVLDEVAPHVRLITETNVPHRDNISYFGDGHNEAQMVYNFALPPLTLHALRTGDARVLSEWASGLILPSEQTTFFNFLASHDGIGLNPARGILSEAEISCACGGGGGARWARLVQDQSRRLPQPVRAEHQLLRRAQRSAGRRAVGDSRWIASWPARRSCWP